MNADELKKRHEDLKAQSEAALSTEMNDAEANTRKALENQARTLLTNEELRATLEKVLRELPVSISNKASSTFTKVGEWFEARLATSEKRIIESMPPCETVIPFWVQVCIAITPLLLVLLVCLEVYRVFASK